MTISIKRTINLVLTSKSLAEKFKKYGALQLTLLTKKKQKKGENYERALKYFPFQSTLQDIHWSSCIKPGEQYSQQDNECFPTLQRVGTMSYGAVSKLLGAKSHCSAVRLGNLSHRPITNLELCTPLYIPDSSLPALDGRTLNFSCRYTVVYCIATDNNYQVIYVLKVRTDTLRYLGDW
ncbi:hypothetical protein J6590_056108 [Homalodisca vitripennis]|nr:hypothetical protein J6590_056108 [Homalodisca vitripennis]